MKRRRVLVVVAGAAAVWGARPVGVPGAAGRPCCQFVGPGDRALNKGGFAQVGSVSCGSACDCAAAGSYTDRSGRLQRFVVSEQKGVWGQGVEVPGLAALAGPHDAEVGSVSCASAGNCAAGGGYQAGHASDRGVLSVETDTGLVPA